MQRVINISKCASLGDYLRQKREALAVGDRAFTLRQLAMRCGVTPAYLSRVERDEVAPPGEDTYSSWRMSLEKMLMSCWQWPERGSVANSDTVSKIGLMYCQGQLR